MRLSGITFAAALLASAAAPHAASAASAFNWSGAYVGAQGGYGWSQIVTGETHMYDDAGGTEEDTNSPIPAFSYSGTGFIGGGEAGYNWQAGAMVLGIVADMSAANISGSYTNSDFNFSVDTTINWLGTARVNVGVPMGNVLLYGTGGLAYGGVTSGLHDVYDGGDTVINSSANTTNLGWAAGAGIAAALGHNWIVKAEYLYADLGSQSVSFSEPDPGFPLITSSGKVTASMLRFALDYKF